MDFIKFIIDFILHVDCHLIKMTIEYGIWIYAILFLIIFCETGLVFTPFLPGDSLLFVAGALAGAARFDPAGCATILKSHLVDGVIPVAMHLDPFILCAVLISAAIIGDNLNYFIGRRIGPAIYNRPDSRFIKQAHIQRTREFFEKHGVKTIILARFVPIIRTFTPFIAGVGAMRYRRFLPFDIIGGIVWITIFVSAGYFFGNIPWVRKNLTLVIFAIVIISVLPIVIEYIRHKRAARAESKT